MDWIDENVAIGNKSDSLNVNRLKKEGIDVMINARTLFDDSRGRSRRVPEVEKVRRATTLLVSLAQMKVKVLVYCYHGRDRAPFIVMLYLTKRLGMDHHKAYDLVKLKRDITVMHWDWVEYCEKGMV
jgi:protein tyrosine/serine phosphatase